MGVCLSRNSDAGEKSENKNNAENEQDEAKKPAQHPQEKQNTPEEENAIRHMPSEFEVADSLKQIPLLCRLSKDDRQTLAKALNEEHWAPNTIVIQQRDAGDKFYLIKQGQFQVVHFDEETKDDVVIATLGKGDYFGEQALITSELRGASVIAIEASTTLSLDKKAFIALFGDNKLNVTFAKRNAISGEVLKDHGTMRGPKNAVREKYEGTRSLIEAAVKKNVLFSTLDNEQLREIVDAMYKMDVEEGHVLIKQGEPGDNFYVVESGHFDIFVENSQGEQEKVTSRPLGTSFGELALMYNSPRAATVQATEDSVVWAVHRFAFRRILMRVTKENLRKTEEFLKRVPLLSAVLTSERSRLAEAMEEQSYKSGTIVLKEGDEGDTFYIVRSGEGKITKHDPDVGEDIEVNRVREGDYFGERALLEREKRAATVTASTPMICLTLDSSAFMMLLGPLEDMMKRKMSDYRRRGLSDANRFLDIQLEDLNVIGTLGKGSFGHVQLVKLEQGGEEKTFALKAVSKAQVVELGQQDHVMSEKNVMARLNNPFLIKLFCTFNTQNCLYFLLEVALGGELFTVLRNRTYFDEDTARFYAASVVLAFEYLHERDIIYRDLKPENLLLDNDGYLKVTDFGFAKVCPERTYTLCGTPDYLAPEMVTGQGHGKGIDWWTLGVLIYEMLASYPPFYDEDPLKTYAKIMQSNPYYPRHFTKDAVHLIKGLLENKPTQRLGVIAGGVGRIKKHPWFAGYDWDALKNRTLKAPIIPQIRSKYDMSNFDDYPTEPENVVPYRDDGSGWDRDF